MTAASDTNALGSGGQQPGRHEHLYAAEPFQHDDLIQSAAVEQLARGMRRNSERWFPRWHSPELGMPLTVAYALGLAGEVGEVANVVKKLQRDGHADGEGLGPELADCLTYLLLLADEVGVDIVAEYYRKAIVNEARWGPPAARGDQP